MPALKQVFVLAGSFLPLLPTHTSPMGLAAALDMIRCLLKCCWLKNGREVKGKQWVREVLEIFSSIRGDLLIYTFQKRYSNLG